MHGSGSDSKRTNEENSLINDKLTRGVIHFISQNSFIADRSHRKQVADGNKMNGKSSQPDTNHMRLDETQLERLGPAITPKWNELKSVFVWRACGGKCANAWIMAIRTRLNYLNRFSQNLRSSHSSHTDGIRCVWCVLTIASGKRKRFKLNRSKILKINIFSFANDFAQVRCQPRDVDHVQCSCLSLSYYYLQFS